MRDHHGAADPVWDPNRAAGFSEWLLDQRHRNDPVGDLARDAALDPAWPAEAATKSAYREHLRTQGAFPGALAALDAAWAEYARARKRRSRGPTDPRATVPDDTGTMAARRRP